MARLRLRYENGHFVPLDPLPEIQEGEEIVVEVRQEEAQNEIDKMLDQTAGMWADIADEMEAYLQDAREKWDKEWFDNLPSL
ncbi:MAG: antitoxin family protein [Anaerolineae bacterium]|nr:antitoxin family protein [Anaerolineae bacterium]